MTELGLSIDLLDSPATADLDALVSAQRRTDILRLASRFAVPVRAVGYECRLSRDDAAVDYNLAFFATARLTQALVALRERPAASRRWQKVGRLLEAWSRGASELTPLVPFICAAFDHADAGQDLPVPSLSFCVDPEFYVRRLGKALPPVPLAHIERVADCCARRLLDQGEISEGPRQALRRLVTIDDSIDVRHLSLMLSRATPAIKIDARLPRSALGPFLEQLGWGVRSQDVASDVDTLFSTQAFVQLNLPLDVHSESTLEVEVLNDRADAPASERARVLAKLTDQGLVCTDKARCLEQISAHPRIVTPTGQMIARSWYLKLRYHAGKTRDAKAYVGLLPHGSGRCVSLASLACAQEQT